MVAGVWPSSDQRKSVVDSTISLFHRQGTLFSSLRRGQDFLHFLIYCTEDKKTTSCMNFQARFYCQTFFFFFYKQNLVGLFSNLVNN